ncbi:ferritin family protein [bacterium]|nr:ferritin family protein [bacterium]
MNDAPDKQDILEPLKIALRLEHEGRKFFQEAAQRCEGKLPRQTFEFLAAEEDKHIEHIEQFYKSLVDSPDAVAPRTDDSATDDRFSALHKRLDKLKSSITADASDLEAYQTALQFENGAEEFYAEQAEKATKPAIRDFYLWLIREEERHARLLESCVKFVKDPASFFQEPNNRK